MGALPKDKRFRYYQFTLFSAAAGRRKVKTYAPSPAAARKTTGAYPDETISVDKVPDQAFRDIQCPRKVKTKDLLRFYETLLRYMRSGASLSDGIVAAGFASGSPLLRGICGDVVLGLIQGTSLSVAMGQYAGIYGESEIAAIEAAEMSGEYVPILDQIIRNLRRRDQVAGKIKSAMAYPVVMLVAALGVLAFIQLKVYPIFRKQFEVFDFELPKITQFAMDVSGFVEDYPVVAFLPLIGLVVLVAGWKQWWKFDRFQRVVLFTPIVGKAIRYTVLTRCLSTLGLLMKAGLKDTAAYAIAGKAAGVVLFNKYFLAIRKEVGEGTDPDRAFMMHRNKIGPEGWEVSAQMRIANVDGDTQSALRRVAADFDAEAERLADTLPEFLRPVLVAAVFAIVGIGLISILLPNFSMLVQVLQR